MFLKDLNFKRTSKLQGTLKPFFFFFAYPSLHDIWMSLKYSKTNELGASVSCCVKQRGCTKWSPRPSSSRSCSCHPLSQSSPGRKEPARGKGRERGGCEIPTRLGVFEMRVPQGECDTVCSILKLSICCSLGSVSSAKPFTGQALELGSEPQGDLGLRQVSCSGRRGIQTAGARWRHPGGLLTCRLR